MRPGAIVCSFRSVGFLLRFIPAIGAGILGLFVGGSDRAVEIVERSFSGFELLAWIAILWLVVKLVGLLR